jgi:hypothetical protein
MKLEKSKLSATSSFGKKTYHFISSKIFKSKLKKLDMWCRPYNFSLERDKNKKFWESYHNFLLAHKNLIKLMALQRRHIKLPHTKILKLEVQKFQIYIRYKKTPNGA